jgi:hypothetical protein
MKRIVRENINESRQNNDIILRELNILRSYAMHVIKDPTGNVEEFAAQVLDSIDTITKNLK